MVSLPDYLEAEPEPHHLEARVAVALWVVGLVLWSISLPLWLVTR